ncbi:MAG: DUF2807 domain-containing protein [Bacteroidia bacterium]|nr:DUF2807 domain-containing protein [Bacteroidia bacterium]
MKAKKLVPFSILVLLIGLSLVSCEKQGLKGCITGDNDSISKNPSFESFSGIEVDADVVVFVKQGSTQSIRIVGQSKHLENLKTEVSGGALRLYSDRCFSEEGSLPRVYVTIPEITRLDVTGSGRIFTDRLICDILEVKLGGAGTLQVSTDANKLITTLNGSGNISLDGSSNSHTIYLGGSGQINGFPMASNDARIDLKGYGNIELTAIKRLHTKISGSGTVKYKGSPILETEISGIGKLIHVD